jgi:hypothetical protein
MSMSCPVVLGYTLPLRAQDMPWIKIADHGCVIGTVDDAGYRAAAVRLK